MKSLRLSLASLMIAGTALASPAQAALSQNQVFEIRFMEDMIDHHAMAIRMALLCPERAAQPELIAMCADIVKTQKREIALMQGWLREWYGESSSPHETQHGQRDMKHLASLSGGEFEQEFMQMMSGHHAVALEQSAECLVRTSHTQLTNLCADIAQTQAREIRSMQIWLCQWYQRCSLHVMRNMMISEPLR